MTSKKPQPAPNVQRIHPTSPYPPLPDSIAKEAQRQQECERAESLRNSLIRIEMNLLDAQLTAKELGHNHESVQLENIQADVHKILYKLYME